MQDRYTGDIGNFAKYELLRVLAEGNRLGLAWYLYPDGSHNKDGRHAMTDFPDKLRLKAMAEEDIYFAKRDRELITAMHERKLAQHLKIIKPKTKRKADRLEDRYAIVTKEHWYELEKLKKHYRNLIDKALKLAKRKQD